MCYTRHEPVGICAQIIPVSAVKLVNGDLSVVNKYLLIGALLLWLLFVQLPVSPLLYCGCLFCCCDVQQLFAVCVCCIIVLRRLWLVISSAA